MINTLDFYSKLAREDIFEGQLFDLSGQSLNIQQIKSGWVTFENCTINCDQLNFNNIKDSQLILEFKNCNFNCNLTFSNCSFNQLLFNNTKTLKSLKIKKGLLDNGISQFNHFEFSNDINNKSELNTDFQITNTEIKEAISFENINHVEGIFKFVKNIFGDKIKKMGILFLSILHFQIFILVQIVLMNQ
ncbi:hypothetical protein [Flavobacterium sp. WG21]|uniref:hypothetical protein n=1 Tax=Flavobacterium sp. WG21 TaxID=1229487 RepID=UPI000347BD25|nr:hypothetical protein [Flavobacterium sp. WG21]